MEAYCIAKSKHVESILPGDCSTAPNYKIITIIKGPNFRREVVLPDYHFPRNLDVFQPAEFLP